MTCRDRTWGEETPAIVEQAVGGLRKAWRAYRRECDRPIMAALLTIFWMGIGLYGIYAWSLWS